MIKWDIINLDLSKIGRRCGIAAKNIIITSQKTS